MELNGIIKRLAVYLQFRGQEEKKVFCKIKKRSGRISFSFSAAPFSKFYFLFLHV